MKFFYWPVLDTEVFFIRRLVESSDSQVKRFCRVPELIQEVFCLGFCVGNLPLFFSCVLYWTFSGIFFHFRSHSRSRVLTASCQFLNVVYGDTVYIVYPTPYHVARVILSTNSVMIDPGFDSLRRSFSVVFSALWAPRKPMTTLFVNTDSIVEGNFCSTVAPPVLPDAMDISVSTSPPINHTISCNTDSVEMKGFAAQLCGADGIEKLEAQVKEKENQFSRLRKSLNLHRNCCERIVMSCFATSAKIQLA